MSDAKLSLHAGQWGCDEKGFSAVEEQLSRGEHVQVDTDVIEAAIWCGVKNWPNLLGHFLQVGGDKLEAYDWQRLVDYAASTGAVQVLKIALNDPRIVLEDRGKMASRMAKEKGHAECVLLIEKRFPQKE